MRIIAAAAFLVLVGCGDDLVGNLPSEDSAPVEPAVSPCEEQWAAICAAGVDCAPVFDAMAGGQVRDGLSAETCEAHGRAVCAEVDGDPGCPVALARCFPDSGLLRLPDECAPIIE